MDQDDLEDEVLTKTLLAHMEVFSTSFRPIYEWQKRNINIQGLKYKQSSKKFKFWTMKDLHCEEIREIFCHIFGFFVKSNLVIFKTQILDFIDILHFLMSEID